ncbi:MAG: hypothetical protein ACYDCC_15655 [Actinomycetota bacterium]
MNKRQILLVAALFSSLAMLPAHAQSILNFCGGIKYSNSFEQTCSLANGAGVVRVLGVTAAPFTPIDVKIYQTSDPTNVMAECDTSPGVPIVTQHGPVCSFAGLNDLPVSEPLTCDVTGGTGYFACESFA